MQQQIRRQTLTEQVAARVLAIMEQQELAPGQLLPSEAALANEYGVSRPVVREALKTLEAKGVITIANGKGAIVRPVSSDLLEDFFQRSMRIRYSTVIDLLEVRKGIEVQSAQLAAERRTTDDLSELKQTLIAMRAHLLDQDAFTRIDAEFHRIIAGSTRNRMLCHLVESIHEPLKQSIRTVYNQRNTVEKHEFAYTAHAAIYDAIAAGDPSSAAEAMVAHFNEAIRLLSASEEMRQSRPQSVSRAC